jgi:hypothetical protein
MDRIKLTPLSSVTRNIGYEQWQLRNIEYEQWQSIYYQQGVNDEWAEALESIIQAGNDGIFTIWLA